MADAARPDQTAGDQRAGRDAERRDRLDARAEGGGAEGAREVPHRPRLYAAGAEAHRTASGLDRRRGVVRPPSLWVAGPPGDRAAASGLVIGGGGDLALHAIDAATGSSVWHTALPRRVNGTPMTYRSSGGRQFVVVATGGGEDASLVAF